MLLYNLTAYCEEESDPFKNVLDNALSYAEPANDDAPDEVGNDNFDTGEEEIIFNQAPAIVNSGDVSGISGYKKLAKISALDKITGKSKHMVIQVGKSEIFGNIDILVQKCFSSPPPEMHNKILVKIVENKVDEEPRQVFHGWLISNNPAVSNITHHVYEVFAVTCMDAVKDERQKNSKQELTKNNKAQKKTL